MSQDKGADELPIIKALEGRPSELTLHEMWLAAGIIRALYGAVERALRHAQNIGVDVEGSTYANTLRSALTKARGE